MMGNVESSGECSNSSVVDLPGDHVDDLPGPSSKNKRHQFEDVTSKDRKRPKRASPLAIDLSGEIFEEVERLTIMFPDADPNALFARLERADDLRTEFAQIVVELSFPSGSTPNNGELVWSGEWDPDTARHLTIHEHTADMQDTFGHEATNFSISNDRLETTQDLDGTVQEIVEEILLSSDDDAGDDEQLTTLTNGAIVANVPGAPAEAEFLADNEKAAFMTIVQMFPDVDPHFVVQKIATERMSLLVLVEEMTDQGNYPKLRDRMAIQTCANRRNELLDDATFCVDQFLLMFEDPEQYFSDVQRPVSDCYRQHALVQLQNEFRHFTLTRLQREFTKCGHHYYPTYAKLKSVPIVRKGRKPAGMLAAPRLGEVPWPDVLALDEQFFYELQYVRHEDLIKETLHERKRKREERVQRAREDGTLVECPCCCLDDCLPEDLIACSLNEAHTYCRGCAKRQAEECIGRGKHMVPCMASDCDGEIPLGVLRQLLSPQLISLILRRSMEEDLRSANLEHVVACPYCDYLVVCDNDEERVLRCQNPTCFRQSCRLCKGLNHVPLKCDEVEKGTAEAMQRFIENKMAEAMIRICPKCHKRLVKAEGCNHMQCSCGQHLCYMCNVSLPAQDPYGHFDKNRNPNACQLHSSTKTLHTDPSLKAGQEAKKKYLEEHPEFADQLDPKQRDKAVLPRITVPRSRRGKKK